MTSQRMISAIAVLLMAFSVKANDVTAEVKQRLQTLYPATEFTRVQPSHIEGVYEVVMGKNIAYTDPSARYLIFGHLFDMAEQRDLTAEVLETLNRIDVSSLPLDDAIKVIRGRGKRSLFVFSDPDCPYCRKLESELSMLDDVTIYTYLYPIKELHPQAARKARLVWCAQDRSTAWNDLMIKGQIPQTGTDDCQNPINNNVALARSLGIDATPTLILGDGSVVQGAMAASEIEALLAKGAQE